MKKKQVCGGENRLRKTSKDLKSFNMKIVNTFVKVLIVSLLISIGLEIILRYSFSDKLKVWSQPQFQSDSILGYRYIPNSKGILSKSVYHREYSINSFGFPGPQFKKEKNKDIYRIAVVGSSEEAGLNTNGPLNYVNIVGDSLKKMGFRIEVINLSIGRKNPGIRNVKLVKGECLSFNPDLVLFRCEFPFIYEKNYRTSYRGITIHTFEPKSNIDSAKILIDSVITKRTWRIVLYDNIFLFRAYVKYYLDNKETSRFFQWISKPIFDDGMLNAYVRKTFFLIGSTKKEKFVKRYSEKESLAVLIKLTKDLGKRHIRLIVYDTYIGEKSILLKKKFFANHINYLSLNVKRKNEYSFGDIDGHSSQKGHEAIANALYKPLADSLKSYGAFGFKK